MRVLSGTLCQYYYTFGFFLMAAIAYFLNHDWKLMQVRITQIQKYIFFKNNGFFLARSC